MLVAAVPRLSFVYFYNVRHTNGGEIVSLKFEDIPKMTNVGRGATHVPLEFLLEKVEGWQNIEGLPQSAQLQLCPDFQRGHVWSQAQQRAYVEFFLSGGSSARTLYFNAPWWQSMSPDLSAYHAFVLVDGLQRFTALKRFLEGELTVFGARLPDFANPRRFLRLAQDVLFHVNDLRTRAEVLQWYIEMNAGGTPHSPQEIARVQALLAEEKRSATPA